MTLRAHILVLSDKGSRGEAREGFDSPSFY